MFVMFAIFITSSVNAQREENHARFYAGGGGAMVESIHPAISFGMTYNINRIYNSFNVSIAGGHRPIWELRSGYILGRGPFLIPHVGLGYEMKKRTFMLHKEATAPSWSDPDNIILPQRLRFTYGFTAILPTNWEKASLFVTYSSYEKGSEYVEKYPENTSKETQLRGNGNGQLHVNKWQKTEAIPTFFTVGIIKRITWSQCD